MASCPGCGRATDAPVCPSCGTVVGTPFGGDTVAAVSPDQPGYGLPRNLPDALGSVRTQTRRSYWTGLALGVVVAAAGVLGWALLAYVHVRTALIALVVAAGVAAAMRTQAPGDRRAPATVVVLTVLSALVGLLAAQYVLLAHAAHLSVFTVIRLWPVSKIPTLMTTGTDAFTWLIIALAALTGWRYARGLSRPAGRTRRRW